MEEWLFEHCQQSGCKSSIFPLRWQRQQQQRQQRYTYHLAVDITAVESGHEAATVLIEHGERCEGCKVQILFQSGSMFGEFCGWAESV